MNSIFENTSLTLYCSGFRVCEKQDCEIAKKSGLRNLPLASFRLDPKANTQKEDEYYILQYHTFSVVFSIRYSSSNSLRIILHSDIEYYLVSLCETEEKTEYSILECRTEILFVQLAK